MFLLQALNINTAEITQKVDSLNMQKQIIGLAEKVSHSTPKELWLEFYPKLLNFGLKLLIAGLIFVAGYYLIKFIRNSMVRNMTRHHTDQSVQSFLISLVKSVLMVLLLMVCANVLGVDSFNIAALISASVVAIGMAMTNTMSSFAGGLLILISKPFKHGDKIETQGMVGLVDKISIFNTRIVTFDKKVIYIPNGMMSNGLIVNHGAEAYRRCEWTIGVAYGTPYELMAENCRKIIRADKRLKELKDGAPADIQVEIAELLDSSVLFTVRAWTTADCADIMKLEMMKEFYTRLPEAGIEFPFPQVDVHINK